MAVTDAGGVVLSISIESANPYEVRLVEKHLEEGFIDHLPQRLIGNIAYDSDPIDEAVLPIHSSLG